MRRIVVTGVGTINALGHDISSFGAIVAGNCGVRTITCFDTTDFPVKIAAEVQNFDPATVMHPKEVKKAERFVHLSLKAAKEAMLDAFDGSEILVRDPENPESFRICENFAQDFGISSASGIGGLGNIERQSIICLEKGPRRINPFFIPSSLVNMLGGFISIDLNLQGPNVSSVTACAAGTHAIIEAAKTLLLGGAKKMLVVGSEAAICSIGIGGFAAMKALSSRNDDPATASRPFDKDRDGFVMGEGAGALVLEDYDDAKKRGAKIYGELVGFGESGDANHITTPAPGGAGAARAMKNALKMASNHGDPKIGYINAHGTSTAYNDLFETMAIKHVFGAQVPPVSSIKGQIGHCLGAAGAIEAVVSLLAMKDGILPPTINQITPDPECDLDYIPNVAREAKISAVMSNSFGFGGTNGVVIFKKV